MYIRRSVQYLAHVSEGSVQSLPDRRRVESLEAYKNDPALARQDGDNLGIY